MRDNKKNNTILSYVKFDFLGYYWVLACFCIFFNLSTKVFEKNAVNTTI